MARAGVIFKHSSFTGLVPAWESEHYFKPRVNKSPFVLEVLKTTFRFDDSLEGLTEYRKTVTLMVTVHYRKMIQIKINTVKGRH